VLDTKIATLKAEFVSLARHNLAMRRLTIFLGIGVLNATALVAAIASRFKHARDFGAWLRLGLTTIHDRWQATAARNNETRQQLLDELCLCMASVRCPTQPK